MNHRMAVMQSGLLQKSPYPRQYSTTDTFYGKSLREPTQGQEGCRREAVEMKDGRSRNKQIGAMGIVCSLMIITALNGVAMSSEYANIEEVP